MMTNSDLLQQLLVKIDELDTLCQQFSPEFWLHEIESRGFPLEALRQAKSRLSHLHVSSAIQNMQVAHALCVACAAHPGMPYRLNNDALGQEIILCAACLEERYATITCQTRGDGLHCKQGEMYDDETDTPTGIVCAVCGGSGVLVRLKIDHPC